MRTINAAADRLLNLVAPRAKATACSCIDVHMITCYCSGGKLIQAWTGTCTCGNGCCHYNPSCLWYGKTC